MQPVLPVRHARVIRGVVEIDYTFPDADGLTKTVSEQEQLYRPFDYWQYSNLGMVMLGEVIAVVSGLAKTFHLHFMY